MTDDFYEWHLNTETGKMRKVKVSKKEITKKINALLKRDKGLLDILAKM